MVDLIHLCSINSATGVGVADLRRITGLTRGSVTPRRAPSARRKWTRLDDEARAAVIARYQAGETSTALAEEYGVVKSTILSILRTNNAVVRRQPMTPEQVSQAAHLYTSGLSLSQVSEQLGVNQETMRVAILAAGVALRPATGASC